MARQRGGACLTSLILSPRDSAALEAVSKALLAPFDFPTVDAWRSAVNRAAKELLGADKATFRLAGSGVEFFTEDYGPEAFAGYPDRWSEQGFDMGAVTATEIRAVVWDRKTVHQTHLPRLYRTAYWDHVVAIRGYDSLGLTIDPVGDGQVAGFRFHHERPKGRRFGERGQQLLRLVLPAFRAGVTSYLRLATQRTRFGTVLDALTEGAVLFDTGGRLLHSNVAMARLLAEDRNAHASRPRWTRSRIGYACRGEEARGERLMCPSARSPRRGRSIACAVHCSTQVWSIAPRPFS